MQEFSNSLNKKSALQYTWRKCVTIHREKVHYYTQGESSVTFGERDKSKDFI